MEILLSMARWVLDRFGDVGRFFAWIGHQITEGDVWFLFVLMGITVLVFFLTLGVKQRHR